MPTVAAEQNYDSPASGRWKMESVMSATSKWREANVEYFNARYFELRFAGPEPENQVLIMISVQKSDLRRWN